MKSLQFLQQFIIILFFNPVLHNFNKFLMFVIMFQNILNFTFVFIRCTNYTLISNRKKTFPLHI